jgi:hypothetical protein
VKWNKNVCAICTVQQQVYGKQTVSKKTDKGNSLQVMKDPANNFKK